jgi:putative FmdB family regulatory protein
MPIYEYRCANCGFQHEYLQKLSDAPLKDCPECGQPTFCKLVTAAGFQLKGSGWYATDFKNGSQAKPESNNKPAAESESKEKPAESGSAPESKTSESKTSESKAKTDEAKPATLAPAETN